MEFRNLLFNDDITLYRISESELNTFSSLFEKMEDSLSVIDNWRELLLLKSEQKIDSDFSYIEDFDFLLISEKAKDIVASFLLDSHIEYLPCKTETNKYYILNIINLIEDSIIEDVSEFEKTDQGTITNIVNLVFYADETENKPIFKIKELPCVVFISDELEEFCALHNLTGLDFSEDNPFIATDFI